MSEAPVLVLLAAGQAKRYGGCKPLAPLGLHGEAVIDLTVADAVAAGFGDVVLVLGPSTGPAIDYHVRRTWPRRLRTTVALQPVPLGTGHAVLCARQAVGDRPFAVVNGDDVYGVPALAELVAHLAAPARSTEHALVAFDLGDSVVGDNPVTRGTVEIGSGGLLAGLAERKQVRRRPDGAFDTGDGQQPAVLDPSTPVSVNLWGFRPSVWPALQAAVAAAHPDAPVGGALGDPPAAPPLSGDAEVLLPEVVGAMVRSGQGGGAVRVLRGPGQCVGVTHADDLPMVRAVLAAMVGTGERAEWPWEQPA